jgi:hypothetical protein
MTGSTQCLVTIFVTPTVFSVIVSGCVFLSEHHGEHHGVKTHHSVDAQVPGIASVYSAVSSALGLHHSAHVSGLASSV